MFATVAAAVGLLGPGSAAQAAVVESGNTAFVLPGGTVREPLAEVYPSNYEQYLVELINRARADPLAETARTGLSDLNEGVPPEDTISPDPKQPLAIHLMLTDAARLHSQWMINTDTFSHYEPAPRATPGNRMSLAGYSFVPSWTWGENIAIYMSYPNAPDTTATVAALHDALFVDEDYLDRGHRVNLLNGTFKEIGAGVATGLFYSSPYQWQSVDCTEDFAMSSYLAGDSFITGVAYDDTLVTGDDFYTPGEGLGGVTITAVRQSDSLTRTMTTWPSGGYSLRVPPGTYTVTAAGGGLGGTVVTTGVVVGTSNIKRDFRPDMVLPPAPTVAASFDYAWVYPNTPVTTVNRHKSVLTVTVTGGFAGETYAMTLAQDGGPVTSFQVTPPTGIVPGVPTNVDVLGGPRTTSTPGAYTLTITLTGQTRGQSGTTDLTLELRLLGDIVPDGIVNASDKLEMNKRLNGLANLPGVTLRDLDLSGDGTLVNAEDKLAINQVLNGLVVP
jgi:hypothetical protein